VRIVLVDQPAGLGDIIWIQPILERLVRQGWKILFPVVPVYLEWVSIYLPRRNVHYVSTESDYQYRWLIGTDIPVVCDDFMYLPLARSSRFFPGAPVMASKYFLSQTPLSDYRRDLPRIRNLGREAELNEFLKVRDFCNLRLVTKRFGTPPSDLMRDIKLPENSKVRTIEIDYLQPGFEKFSPFDWAGIISKAQEIHFVATSFAFIADLYCSDESEMHLYDRVSESRRPMYLRTFEYVHRHPNWIYHV